MTELGFAQEIRGCEGDGVVDRELINRMADVLKQIEFVWGPQDSEGCPICGGDTFIRSNRHPTRKGHHAGCALADVLTSYQEGMEW